MEEIVFFLEKGEYDYYYFLFWDEIWKVGVEGGVGVYWGFFNLDGLIKEGFELVFL